MTVVAVQERSYLIGLIGAGIGASLSPALHEEEAGRLGLRYVYRRIDLDALKLDAHALPGLLRAAEQMGFDGLNITYPCKQTVVPLLDELSDDARALGAVNTVLLKDGRRIGHNTDWSGFTRAFQRALPGVSLTRVVQLGAGGAGAAVAHAALTMGARTLTLFDVDRSRAIALAADLQRRFPASTVHAGESLAHALAGADGLIHATPTGMDKLPGLPLPVEMLHAALWVADIVYFPIRTALLDAADALGCRTLSGGGMAVYQAADAMRIFTGLEPDAERMYAHFTSLLQRQHAQEREVR